MLKPGPNFVTSVKPMDPYGDTTDVTGTLTSPYAANSGHSEYLAQVARVVNSELLQGSEALCRLVQYLAHHTLHSPNQHLKEYQIAVEVLGRTPDFDPQSDASVRVQVARLRGKLTEYYHSVGVNDPVLIDLPKGRYALTFEFRESAPKPETAPQPKTAAETKPALELVSAPAPPAVPAWNWPRGVLAAVIMAATLLSVGAAVYWRHLSMTNTKPAARSNEAGRTPATEAFWSPFLHASQEPIVVFSNATFVGTAEGGMRYFEPSKDGHEETTQHYTGVGEVIGVLQLGRLFWQRGAEFRIKRGGLFTLDEARNNNLIFVGSPTENLALLQIANTREFVFRRSAAGDRRTEVIVDLHPSPGQPSVYPSSPKTGTADGDFAIVALMHGLEPSQWTLIVAGVSTLGTQAAVNYVCEEGSLAELLHRLNVKKASELKPFEALLRVRVAKDVPLETQLVALRPAGD
jgi:hypothetical protein